MNRAILKCFDDRLFSAEMIRSLLILLYRVRLLSACLLTSRLYLYVNFLSIKNSATSFEHRALVVVFGFSMNASSAYIGVVPCSLVSGFSRFSSRSLARCFKFCVLDFWFPSAEAVKGQSGSLFSEPF